MVGSGLFRWRARVGVTAGLWLLCGRRAAALAGLVCYCACSLRGRTRFRCTASAARRRLHARGPAGGDRLGRRGGGAAQKFDMRSRHPGRVVEGVSLEGARQFDRPKRLQANPSLQAAQAALWQAKENLYAQRGKLLPSVDANSSATRQQFSPAEFGGGGAPSIFNLFQATVNVSYAPDVFGGQRRQIESTQAQADYQRFELEATYLTLTSNVVTAASRKHRCAARSTRRSTSSRPRPISSIVVRNQFTVGAAATHRCADAAIGSRHGASDLAAAAKAT